MTTRTTQVLRAAWLATAAVGSSCVVLPPTRAQVTDTAALRAAVSGRTTAIEDGAGVSGPAG